MSNLYKLVVRDPNGKVIQVYEQYYPVLSIDKLIKEEVDKGNSLTITKLR